MSSCPKKHPYYFCLFVVLYKRVHHLSVHQCWKEFLRAQWCFLSGIHPEIKILWVQFRSQLGCSRANIIIVFLDHYKLLFLWRRKEFKVLIFRIQHDMTNLSNVLVFWKKSLEAFLTSFLFVLLKLKCVIVLIINTSLLYPSGFIWI